ncbi:SurA N-terminal domain-containing protein [Verrucomicrobiota bacterium]
MLITKFNRMIRSKVLWSIFAVVVSVSFVGFLGPRQGCGSADDRRIGEGSLYGENVSSREFVVARFFELGLKDNVPLTPEENEDLRARVWRRLAVLKKARQIGIETTDGELRDTIRQDPAFSVNGVFNQERYRNAVQTQLRVSVEIFEAYLRESLTTRKLMRVLESLTWIGPSEVRRRITSLTDGLRVEFAVIRPGDLSVDPEVSDEQVRAFFDENQELFTEPEKRRVRYVVFAITNYLSDAEADYEDVVAYYNEHIEDYAATDVTNETALPVPLDDVQGQIEAILATNAAAFAAKDAATEFVMALARDRYGNAMSFDSAAATNGLTIFTSEYFAADQDVPGLGVGPEFNRTAFGLDRSDPDSYFSDALAADESVYVMAFEDGIEAAVPEFEGARERVLPLARSNAVHDAVLARVEEISEACEANLAAGVAFSAAMADHGISVATSQPFSVYQGMVSNDADYAEAILPNVLTLRQGELTDPIEFGGEVLLVYVAERSPGEFGLVQSLRPQLLSTLHSYRAGLLYDDWGDHLLSAASFEDYRSARALEEEAEEDEAAEPPATDL